MILYHTLIVSLKMYVAVLLICTSILIITNQIFTTQMCNIYIKYRMKRN